MTVLHLTLEGAEARAGSLTFCYVTNMNYICDMGKQLKSTHQLIKEAVIDSGEGSILYPNQFAPCGDSTAIRQVLSRMTKEGYLVRLAHGLYYYPKVDTKWGTGIIYPSIEEVARIIEERDKITLIPSGTYVLNKLGLSTQIPMNVVYISNGSPRTIKLGKGRGIQLKRSNDMNNCAYTSELVRMLVFALREIGQGNLTEVHKSILKKHLRSISEEEYKRDIHLAPQWIQDELNRLREQ